jgi:hypothetical protein
MVSIGELSLLEGYRFEVSAVSSLLVKVSPEFTLSGLAVEVELSAELSVSLELSLVEEELFPQPVDIKNMLAIATKQVIDVFIKFTLVNTLKIPAYRPVNFIELSECFIF